MARQGQPPSFRPRSAQAKAQGAKASATKPAAGKAAKPAAASRSQVIPEAVANRMARRIAIATGLPTAGGMGVFVASYFLVSRGVLDIPPGVTLLLSGGFFLLGLVGLSYGVLSSSWEDAPGSLLGTEQIGLNIMRLRQSVRALRQGSGSQQPPG